MAEKENLKVMKCPTCGASLKTKNPSESVTCLYCGNTIIPVTDTNAVMQSPNAANGVFSGVVKVEGIKTSSSALAYIELFFAEYDWEAFYSAQNLSISEIDKLVSSLKVSSADDKNTWFACFKAKSVPFMKKIIGCKQILNSVIAEYQQDSLDAYSMFDAYKRVVSSLIRNKDIVLTDLQKCLASAEKYGATAQERETYSGEISAIIGAFDLKEYAKIEEIPEINKYIKDKNARIIVQLAEKGLDASALYQLAKEQIQQRAYVDALTTLRTLDGYADSAQLAEKLDKYFLLSDVLEINGNLYFFQKDTSANSYRLYPTANGKIGNKPIIQDIAQIITNYATILYYINDNGKLIRYHLATGSSEKLFKGSLKKDSIFVYNGKVYLLSYKHDEYNNTSSYNLVELDVATGAVRTLVEHVKKIISMTDGKLVYTVRAKAGSDSNASFYTYTNVLDVDNMKQITLGAEKLNVEGFMGDCVVYTKAAPNEHNNDIYIKNMLDNCSEQLLERNIYKFCAIIEDKIFYYIGNSKNLTLINISADGSERKEWPLFVNKILFAQGGWVYFTRKSGYNVVLCKSRLDGSKYKIIAADIEEFIEIKNGYLYYINDEATLVKVRMDGSNLQELCNDVESVLSVKEDKIIFVSMDDKIKTDSMEMVSYKTVKSIYAVDFTGSGKIKLAYNINNAKEYDDDNVYFLDSNPGVLRRLNVNNNQSNKLLELEQISDEENWGFLIAILVMFCLLFLTIACFVGNVPGFGIVLLIASIISACIASALKKQKG